MGDAWSAICMFPGGGCYWHLVGGSRGYCLTFYSAQVSPQSWVVCPNVSSTELEKLWPGLWLFSLSWIVSCLHYHSPIPPLLSFCLRLRYGPWPTASAPPGAGEKWRNLGVQACIAFPADCVHPFPVTFTDFMVIAWNCHSGSIYTKEISKFYKEVHTLFGLHCRPTEWGSAFW